MNVPASVTHVHTGIHHQPGQSVEITATGSWGRAGGESARVDISLSVSEHLPLLGLTAIVGPARWRITRRPGRLLAVKAGELVLSPWQQSPDPWRLMTRPALVGQAHAVIVTR